MCVGTDHQLCLWLINLADYWDYFRWTPCTSRPPGSHLIQLRQLEIRKKKLLSCCYSMTDSSSVDSYPCSSIDEEPSMAMTRSYPHLLDDTDSLSSEGLQGLTTEPHNNGVMNQRISSDGQFVRPNWGTIKHRSNNSPRVARRLSSMQPQSTALHGPPVGYQTVGGRCSKTQNCRMISLRSRPSQRPTILSSSKSADLYQLSGDSLEARSRGAERMRPK